MITTNAGDTLFFALNETTAFFMRGSLNWDHNAFIVNIQPHPRGGNVKRRQLNSTTHWCDQLAVVYFETGLDPRTTYLISIVNIGGAPGAAFALRHVDVMKPSLSGLSSTTAPASPSNDHLSASEIAGISVRKKHI
jgi:hypothetical protein